MSERSNFTSPVGRLVAGSLYKGNDKDAEGRPLVYKNGADAGKPRLDFFFALAIPKGPEAAKGPMGWMDTPWGQVIRKAGESMLPHAAQLPTFAWKVKDGDSTIPNKRGRRPCDQEGHKGHWIMSFSSGFAPTVYTADGSAVIAEPGAVKLGYYVQVNADVGANGSQSQPGVYINHRMVALSGYGPEIVVGPDATSVGFGGGALPPGASAVPLAAMPAPPVPAPAPAPAVAAPPVVMPAPNPAFLMPPPPAAPVVPRMTAKAAGATYEQLIAAGWTADLLRQHGMIE